MTLSSVDVSFAASSQRGLASSAVQLSNPSTSVDKGFVPVNPLEQGDWDSLLSTHHDSSFFHTAAWVRVLHQTYGHRPFYFSRISDSRLQALLPTMEVSSWCTG